jgi:hypothetical protein
VTLDRPNFALDIEGSELEMVPLPAAPSFDTRFALITVITVHGIT